MVKSHTWLDFAKVGQFSGKPHEKRAKACPEPAEGLTKNRQNLHEIERTWAFTNHSESQITSHLCANQQAVVLFWEPKS